MKEQSYTELKQKAPFDWNAFLGRAIEKITFIGESYKAIELSGEWVTCACGIQCALIPRDYEGYPADRILFSLGMLFHLHIVDCDWHKAKETLEKIEIRSAEILKEMGY